MKRLLLAFVLPVSAWAVTRTVTINAPGQVTAGQSFTVPTSASTDATDGEQLGFYHGQYSTDGGASWTWFTADVNAGTSATRNAYITAGGAGSTIIVWVKIAFRGGVAGDVDYNGTAIDWSGSWDHNQSPPAIYAYISVVAPPNQPPTINWIQNPASAFVNQWFAVQSRGNDPDGNLMNVWVWKEWVPFAVNDGGNGYERYSDPNLACGSTPGSINFQTQSFDRAGANSAVIFHTVTIVNRAPRITMSASPTTINFGQSTNLTSVATDADANLAFHGILVLNAAGTDWYRSASTDHSTGWGNHPTTNDFTAISYTSGVTSGGSSTRTATHRPSYEGLPRTITYHNNTHDGYVWASSDAANWAACVGYAYVTVNKATPNQTGWNAQSWTGTGTAPAGAFNVSFSNPYSASVAVPTGAPTFTIVSASGAGASPTSGTVGSSTVFYPGSYTVRCSYPGDANYNAQSWDAVFTVANVAPTAAMSLKGLSSGTTTGVINEVLTITVSGADADGNLRAVNLWVLTPNFGWRNIRSDSTVAAGFTENTTTDNAINSASNVSSLGSVNRTFTIAPGQGIGTYSFVVRSMDAPGTASTSQQVNVTVGKATPVLTWSPPAPITYGTALSGTQLNATASVSGTFVYNPASGAVLNAGPQTLSVTFTPSDTVNYNSVTQTVPLTVNKAPLTVTANNASKTYGTANPAFSASYTGFVNGDTVAVVSGAPSFTTPATTSSSIGGYAITPALNTLSVANYSFGPFVNGTLTVNPLPVSFTFSNIGFIYDGSPKAPTINNPSGATYTVNGTAFATLGGNYSFTVTANGNYSGLALCNWNIGCCPATVTLGNLSQTYDGTPKAATATTSPAGKSVAFTYNGSSTPPTNAGSYTVVGTVNEPPDVNGAIYVGSSQDTLLIAKAGQAALTLNAATSQVHGTAQTLSSTGGSGSGAVSFAITGQSAAGAATLSGAVLTANTGTGWVDVQATKAADTNYNATTSSTVRITFTKAAQAALTLNAITPQTFGAAQTLSSTGGSGGGTVSYAIIGQSAVGATTLSGAVLTANTGTGWVDLQATKVGDTNYNAAASSVVRVTLAKATATITLGSLSQTYDGSAKPATASTTPVGLAVVFTYNGSASVPVNAGAYAVVGTIDSADPNYTGSSSGTLNIAKATASVTLGSLSQTYNGSPRSATATTVPAGLPVSFTYNGGATVPSLAGGYTVVGTINHANYQGSATGTLNINRAVPTGVFASRTLTMPEGATSYPVAGSDLNATFTDPANVSGPQPTGPVSYVIGAGSPSGTAGSAVSAGMLLPRGSYLVQANYSGDSNYVATAVTATWQVELPASVVNQLGLTHPSHEAQDDTGNATQLKIHRPNTP